ncbi:hypothetical protein [Streptomyces wedmorensis]
MGLSTSKNSVPRHANRSARPLRHHRLPAEAPPDRRNVRDRPGVAPLPRERLHSYANSEPTPHDGTHMTGFRNGMAAAANAHLRKRRLLAETAPNLSTAQIAHGLSLFFVYQDLPGLPMALRVSGRLTVLPTS